MGTDTERAIALIEKSRAQLKDGWIFRSELYMTFIENKFGSESKFNSLIFLLKSFQVVSEYTRANGYHVDLHTYEKFKEKFKGGKK